MSEANRLQSVVGLCVGYRPGGDRGKTLWVDVVDAAPKHAGHGCFLRVAHTFLGRATWIDGESAMPRTKRDAAILAEANKALTGNRITPQAEGYTEKPPCN